MGAATVLYQGSIKDTALIISGMGTVDAAEMIFIPVGPNGLLIMKMGSP